MQRSRVLNVCACSIVITASALGQSSTPQHVSTRFVHSSAADYVMYLLFRSTGTYTDLEKAVPITDVPVMLERISLPEVAASSNITRYEQLFPLIEPYRHPTGRVTVMPGPIVRYRILAYDEPLPSYDRIDSALEKGAAEYPAFLRYWNEHIGPDEASKIAIWKEQADKWRPFDGLQELARLRYPVDHVDIGALALHGAGSGNTDPEGIYSSIAVKNVAWLVGHEGTHLLVDEFGGLNWKSRPGAKEAIALSTKHGGTGPDIEEALCLLMQVKLSQLYGQTPKDYRISPRLDPSVKRVILAAFEDHWAEYQADKQVNLMDWMIAVTHAALDKPVLIQP